MKLLYEHKHNTHTHTPEYFKPSKEMCVLFFVDLGYGEPSERKVKINNLNSGLWFTTTFHDLHARRHLPLSSLLRVASTLCGYSRRFQPVTLALVPSGASHLGGLGGFPLTANNNCPPAGRNIKEKHQFTEFRSHFEAISPPSPFFLWLPERLRHSYTLIIM